MKNTRKQYVENSIVALVEANGTKIARDDEQIKKDKATGKKSGPGYFEGKNEDKANVNFTARFNNLRVDGMNVKECVLFKL